MACMECLAIGLEGAEGPGVELKTHVLGETGRARVLRLQPKTFQNISGSSSSAKLGRFFV